MFTTPGRTLLAALFLVSGLVGLAAAWAAELGSAQTNRCFGARALSVDCAELLGPTPPAALLPSFDEPVDGLVDILAGLFDLFHIEPPPSDAIIRDAENGDSPHRER